MKMLFKYFSAESIEHVFIRDEHVGIKCSLPQDYNDPFELFLGVDLDQETELLATYREVVEEIPAQLTTCFSKSPVVAPMWAHYANNHSGYVIGFDVVQFQELFPEILIHDITYADRPSETLVGFTQMAAQRKKPRDAAHLRNAVRFHGYFTKYLEWSYEQEARAVNFEEYVEDVNGYKILYVPKQCIAAIISGAKSSLQTRQTLTEAASELDAQFYNERIGRSFPTPYLVPDGGNPSVFSSGEIGDAVGICRECSEPLRVAGDLCPWCSINESHQLAAAAGNPFRILDSYGLLDEYLEKFPTRPRKPYVDR
ncbi:DUF2971 domain-containing protein [Rhizobium laguerreae]|uniref:DUF2971 domain-containing protein n=1 Tax=Rhizobium laguerreae TaxID=1076926 RepID=UPI001C925FCB|nr:DUF2971 domain-containing protein [Rhizobium laguerreae]MBY3123216.1 DUF2971 domain-containing protein [Rhizobium laguerreae]